MNYELTLGVPAPPSGFPLYLSPLTLQKDAAPIPNAAGECVHDKYDDNAVCIFRQALRAPLFIPAYFLSSLTGLKFIMNQMRETYKVKVPQISLMFTDSFCVNPCQFVGLNLFPHKSH